MSKNEEYKINDQIALVFTAEEYNNAMKACRDAFDNLSEKIRPATETWLYNNYPQNIIYTPHPTIKYQEFVTLYNAKKINQYNIGGNFSVSFDSLLTKKNNLKPFIAANTNHKRQPLVASFANETELDAKEMKRISQLSDADFIYEQLSLIPDNDGLAGISVGIVSSEGGEPKPHYVLWEPDVYHGQRATPEVLKIEFRP